MPLSRVKSGICVESSGILEWAGSEGTESLLTYVVQSIHVNATVQQLQSHLETPIACSNVQEGALKYSPVVELVGIGIQIFSHSLCFPTHCKEHISITVVVQLMMLPAHQLHGFVRSISLAASAAPWSTKPNILFDRCSRSMGGFRGPLHTRYKTVKYSSFDSSV